MVTVAPQKLVSARGFPFMSVEGRFAQTHPVKGRAEVFVEVLCGHIHVTASDLEEIQVRALARARAGIVAPVVKNRRGVIQVTEEGQR